MGTSSYISLPCLLAWHGWGGKGKLLCFIKRGELSSWPRVSNNIGKHRYPFPVPRGDIMLYQVLGIITEHQHFAAITAKCISINSADSSLTLTNPSTRAGKEKEEECHVLD